MILLTAATPWESRPLARRLGLAPETEGLFRAGERVLLETGMGAGASRAALERLELGSPLTLVISTGFAGGLQPRIAPGDLLIDPRELPPGLESAARRIAASAGIPLHVGRIVSVDSPLTEPEGKRSLGAATQGAGVDMESEAVRGWAVERRAPFASVRAVFDAMDDRLPGAVPDSPGAADTVRFLMGSWKDIPHLLRLGRIRSRGLRNLSRFLGEFMTSGKHDG